MPFISATSGAFGYGRAIIQPYSFDQLCGPSGSALYNRYRVYKVDYVVVVANDVYNIHYAVLNTNDASPPIGNVSEARENPRCQYACQNTYGAFTNVGANTSFVLQSDGNGNNWQFFNNHRIPV